MKRRRNQPRIQKHLLAIPTVKRERDPKHRKFISTLNCAVCKIGGFSQAAHIGKGGMGLKESDEMIIPLCCARPGIEGCHIESAKNEKKFYEKRGGIEAAKELATNLYKHTGDWTAAMGFIARF